MNANSDVTVELGRMPGLWRESAVFVANIGQIFYGDAEKTAHLKANVAGFESYGTRMLPILGLLYQGQNLLVLNEIPRPEIQEYFSALATLNLPDVVRLPAGGDGGQGFPEESDVVAERIRIHPGTIVDGYVTDPELERFAEAIGKSVRNSYASSRNANDKVLLFRHLGEQGLPVFDGGESEPGPRLERILEDLKALGYRKAIIRSALGASGFGMAIRDLAAGAQTPMPGFLSREQRVLCQGWIEPALPGIERIISPSVQFFCHGAGLVTLFDVTEQLLSQHSIHEGNVVPPPHLPLDPANPVYAEMIRQSEIVCRWVASTGYRGTGSIDFLVYEQHGIPMIRVCEVNARVTGATYPSLLARHFLPHGAWIMRNYGFEGCEPPAGFLDALLSHKLLYEAGQGTGILPINVIADRSGFLRKAQILFLAEAPAACEELAVRFPEALPYGCIHDRD